MHTVYLFWIFRITYIFTHMFLLIHCIITFDDSLIWKQVRSSANKLSVVKTNFDLSFVLVPSATFPMICWTMNKCDSFFTSLHAIWKHMLTYVYFDRNIWSTSVTRIEFKYIWECIFMHIWCNFLQHVYYIQPNV